MNCCGENLKKFIDLGQQPNGNHFPTKADKDSELKFPFSMLFCEDCGQVQIEEFPSVEFMFSNHPYVTGLNMPIVDHFKILVERTIFKYELSKNDLVIDIGSNDGTLLSIFREKGLRVLGIDPGSNTCKLSRDKGITVFETFWSYESSKSIKKLNIKPKLITATSVFYHVEDMHDFIKGLAHLMEEDSIFVTQCVYMKDVLEKYQFDHFYHEHTMMHSLLPLKRIFNEYGFKLLDVDFYNVHGGSFVLSIAKESSKYQIQPNIKKAIQSEIDFGMQKLSTYLNFAKKVDKNKKDLIEVLTSLKEKNKTIYALGAPLKGSTLLNYYSIGPELVDLATEVNQFKIDKLTPGTHIPIVNENLIDKQPDYYLLLAWNYLEFFCSKYFKYLENGGKFIVPHPEVKIISK